MLVPMDTPAPWLATPMMPIEDDNASHPSLVHFHLQPLRANADAVINKTAMEKSTYMPSLPSLASIANSLRPLPSTAALMSPHRSALALPPIRFECSISNILSAAKLAPLDQKPCLPSLPSLLKHNTSISTSTTSSFVVPESKFTLCTPPNAGIRSHPHATETQSPMHQTHRVSIRKQESSPSSSSSSSSYSSKPVVKCRREDCTNAARRKGLCMEHGGRHFCKMDGCQKCAHRGGFCISHGGGRRCAVENCTKSAQSGGICYSHGGGKRCAEDGCSHAARSGGYCIKHGKQHLQQQQL